MKDVLWTAVSVAQKVGRAQDDLQKDAVLCRQIGDGGVKDLADACAKGAYPKLAGGYPGDLYIGDNPASEAAILAAYEVFDKRKRAA